MNAVEIVAAVMEELEDHYESGDGDKDEELIDNLYVLFEIERRAKQNFGKKL